MFVFLNKNNGGIELYFDKQVEEPAIDGNRSNNSSRSPSSSSRNSSTHSSTSSSTNINSTSSSSPIIISSESSSSHEEVQPRRSDRKIFGVPPNRYDSQKVNAKYMNWYKDFGDKEKDDKMARSYGR